MISFRGFMNDRMHNRLNETRRGSYSAKREYQRLRSKIDYLSRQIKRTKSGALRDYLLSMQNRYIGELITLGAQFSNR